MVKKYLLRFGAPALALAVFLFALRFLNQEFSDLQFKDVTTAFRQISHLKIIWAFALTVLSYFILTFYDLCSINFAKASLSYWRTAFASFVGYTLSHNLGFSVLTGTAARFRLFSAWGFSPKQIAQSISFSALIFWLGLFTLAGAVFVIEPIEIPKSLSSSNISLRLIGIVCLFCLAVFLTFIFFRKRPLLFYTVEIPTPDFKLVLSGLSIAAADWLVAAGVAFSLMPASHITFLQFVGLFQLAQFTGLMSHVPAGIGVFEAVILAFYAGSAPVDQLVGALLAYRLIYYIFPLCCSLLLLFSYEIAKRWTSAARWLSPFSQAMTSLAPLFLSTACFGSGIILLISGALPPLHARHQVVENIIPLAILELSHFMGSIVGFGLLILALGLRRRLDGAYFVTCGFLILGIIASLLKGFDYEEAFVLMIVLTYLIISRKNFYRKSSLTSQVLDPDWLLATALVVTSTIIILFFAFKHTPYSNQLWWEFSLDGHAPRALRATVGAAVAMFFFGFYELVHAAPAEPAVSNLGEIEEILPLVQASSATSSHLALLGDKSFLLNQDKSAFIMYGVEGSSWIAMGDPIGDKAAFADLIWEFKAQADLRKDLAVFYQIKPDCLPLYVDAGFSLLKLGDEAIVPLDDFTIDGRLRRPLRHTRNRIVKEGFTFEIIAQTETTKLIPQLRKISNEWLKQKNTREKAFSLGYFDENYLKRCPIALIKKDSQIVAFANLWATTDKEELSLDLMRHSAIAPSGVMDFLFIELMLWGQKNGFKRFNLGMAPLSGLEDHFLAPRWHKIGNLVFRHAEHFYNFQGILAYKEKFKPIWEPRYLASPGGIRLPLVFASIAALISRGMKGVLSK